MSARPNCSHDHLTRASDERYVWICDKCGAEIAAATVHWSSDSRPAPSAPKPRKGS